MRTLIASDRKSRKSGPRPQEKLTSQWFLFVSQAKTAEKSFRASECQQQPLKASSTQEDIRETASTHQIFRAAGRSPLRVKLPANPHLPKIGSRDREAGSMSNSSQSARR